MVIALIIIFVGASIVFWIGCFADAATGPGVVKEKTKWFRNAAGGFDPRKYFIINGALQVLAAGVAVAGLVAEVAVFPIGMAAMMVVGGVLRLRAAARNRKIQEQRRQAAKLA